MPTNKPKDPDAQQRAAYAREQKQKWEERRDELQRKAKEDPEQVFLDLFANLSAGVTLLSEKWLNSGKDPSRNLMDSLREFRQSADKCIGILQARGASTQTHDFLAGVAARISEASLEVEPRPVGDAA